MLSLTIVEINWKTNLEEGLKNQRKNKKDILIYFGTSWCAPCNVMEKKVFSSSVFTNYSQNFEMIKIYDDFKKGDKVKYDYFDSTRKKFGINSYPSFIILKNNQKQCHIKTSYDPIEFIENLKLCK